MKTDFFSKIDHFSGTVLGKQVMSKTTKLSSQSNQLLKFSAAFMENLEDTGITKTKFAYREEHFYPNTVQMIKKCAMSCEQCIRESRIDCNFIRFPLKNPYEHITAWGDAMQTDLKPELPPFSGYEYIVTVVDVFSRHIFAYPTSNQDAKKFARVIFNIMNKHAYWPTDQRHSFWTKDPPFCLKWMKKWPVFKALL